eukprot:2331239-Amphidinium_carterae.1
MAVTMLEMRPKEQTNGRVTSAGNSTGGFMETSRRDIPLHANARIISSRAPPTTAPRASKKLGCVGECVVWASFQNRYSCSTT